MSKTSSAETPTSPIAPIFNQNPHHQHNQHQLQQYTTKAIVIGSGSGCGGTQKAKPPPPPRRSSTSNTSMSFNVTAADTTMNTCANVTVNKAHATLTPSASTSSSASSTSAASSACTSAAVQQQQQHHQHQHHNHHSYSQHHHQNVASNIENGCNGRPSTSMSAVSVSISGVTPNSIKRHTDIVCSSSSSSSSCCSSSGSISGTCGAQTNAVTPTVVNSGPLIAQKMSRTPSDKINLRLILVSGKTKEFLFNPSDSAGDIAQTVFDNWPEDWEREAVSKAEILRLIYQGRFLHCNVTLGALGLPLGKTTVMHLVPRDNLPEPNSQDQRQKSKGGSSRCCSTTCCIL